MKTPPDLHNEFILIELLSQIPDPRHHNTVHPLPNLLFITLVGSICGMRSWEDIVLFANFKRDFFERFLDLSSGIPCEKTFGRVFSMLNSESLENVMKDWIKMVVVPSTKEVVAIDGKSVRNALNKNKSASLLHSLHIWAVEQRLLLGYKKIEGAPQEPVAIRELLPLIDIKNKIITTDANGCTAEIARIVKKSGGNYVLAIKANRGEHFEDVKKVFKTSKRQDVYEQKEEVKKHGRLEERKIFVASPSKEMKEKDQWYGLKSVVKIERKRKIGDKIEDGVGYYIASIKKEAKEMGNIVRSHWMVENDLHWSLDVIWKEDTSRINKCNKKTIENMAVIRRMALMMIKQRGGAYSAPARQKMAAWNEDALLRILSS